MTHFLHLFPKLVHVLSTGGEGFLVLVRFVMEANLFLITNKKSLDFMGAIYEERMHNIF